MIRLAFFMMMVGMSAAEANCAFIRDPDQHSLCFGRCSFIRDADLRYTFDGRWALHPGERYAADLPGATPLTLGGQPTAQSQTRKVIAPGKVV